MLQPFLNVTAGAGGQQVVDGVGDRVGVGATVGWIAGAAFARLRVAAGLADGDAVRDGDRLAGEADAADAAAVADAVAEDEVVEAAGVGAADDGAGAVGAGSLPAPYM
jgi:hypothetical protein